jgi:hypothetical protein
MTSSLFWPNKANCQPPPALPLFISMEKLADFHDRGHGMAQSKSKIADRISI